MLSLKFRGLEISQHGQCGRSRDEGLVERRIVGVSWREERDQ